MASKKRKDSRYKIREEKIQVFICLDFEEKSIENDILIQDRTIGELKIRFQEIVERLKQLITRVSEKTELAVFLIDICQVRIFKIEINDFQV